RLPASDNYTSRPDVVGFSWRFSAWREDHHELQHGSAGLSAARVVDDGKIAQGRGDEGGHGRENGEEVSQGREASQRDQRLAARVADTGGSVRGRLGRSARPVGGESWAGGQDPIPLVAADVPGAVPRRAAPHAPAAAAAVAGDGRPGQGGV